MLSSKVKTVVESSGLSIAAFARKFGVTAGYVSQLIHRRLATISPLLAQSIVAEYNLPADHFAAYIHARTQKVQRTAGRYKYLGLVAAGKGADEPAETGEWVDIPAMCPNASGVYRVRGMSMVDCGIHDGDYLIVQRDESPDTGSVVVAFLRDRGNVVKRLKRKRDGDYLHSEDGKADPRYPVKMGDGDRFHGVLLAVFRPYTSEPKKGR